MKRNSILTEVLEHVCSKESLKAAMTPTSLGVTSHRLRTCLRCSLNFDSEGAWNRICPECAEENNGVRGVREVRVILENLGAKETPWSATSTGR